MHGAGAARGSGSKAVRVADRDHPLALGDDQAIGAARDRQGLDQRGGEILPFRSRRHLQHDFRIRTGVEHRPFQLERAAQADGIDQVPVVGQRQGAALGLHQERLDVLDPRPAGRRVAVVADRQDPGQLAQTVGREDVRDVSPPRGAAHLPAVRGDDPRRLLSPVLQGVERQVDQVGRLGVPVDRGHAALLEEIGHAAHSTAPGGGREGHDRPGSRARRTTAGTCSSRRFVSNAARIAEGSSRWTIRASLEHADSRSGCSFAQTFIAFSWTSA